MLGDCNEIVKNEEVQGRRQRLERQVQKFCEVLDQCGLMDLGFVGSRFTWCNNPDPPYTTWVRLDRAVATREWLNLFHVAQVEHVDVSNSDHKCLWLQGDSTGAHRRRYRPFRFEEIWLKDKVCEATVQSTWAPMTIGMAMFRVASKIKACKIRLGDWSRRSFGSVSRKLAEKKRQLQDVEAVAMVGGSLGAVKALRAVINMLQGRKDVEAAFAFYLIERG